MRQIFYIGLFVIIGFQSLAQEKLADCKKFHTGEFFMTSDPDILIIRSENFQVEWDKKQMTTSWYRIRWKSPCKFTSTLVKTDAPSELMMKGIPVLIEILETKKKSYKYKISIPEFRVSDFGEIFMVE